MGIDSSGFHPEDQMRIILNPLVSLDLLDSFDGLIWMQSGKQVGDQFQQHQTTVSRNQKKCAQTFGVDLKKENGIWTIDGDTRLLYLERGVHQAARFQKKAPLRLETNGWTKGFLYSPMPEGCITGSCKPLGVSRCLSLLDARIVDVWLCPLPDAPNEHDALSIHALCKMPMRLMVSPEHPLLEQRSITLNEAKKYPWQRIAPGAYPGTEKQLRALHLWPPERRNRQPTETSLKQTNNLSLSMHVGSVLTGNGNTPGLVALPLELGVETGIALIVKKEHANQKLVLSLRAALRQRLREQQIQHPEIQLID